MKKMQPTFIRPYELTPSNDGVEYINIYSNGKTELGRMLSPFSDLWIDHPVYGRFSSMEGFYYWLKTGLFHDELRYLIGYNAKQVGRKFSKVYFERFEDEIAFANRLKVMKHLPLREKMKANTLPFEHYYCYANLKGGYDIHDMRHQYQRIIDELQLITAELSA